MSRLASTTVIGCEDARLYFHTECIAMDSTTTAPMMTVERRLALFQNLFRQSRSQVAPSQFYQAFLATLVEVFRAEAACVWMAQSGKFHPAFAANLDKVGLTPGAAGWLPHEQLLDGVARQGAALSIAPGQVSAVGTNPLSVELLILPIMFGGTAQGLIELFRAASPAPDNPALVAARIGELGQWCEFLGDYIRSRELASLATQTESEALLRSFVMRLHGAMTKQEAALVAVNEGRQAIGCERVSLGWLVGGRATILAVSGQETINSHSNVVRALIGLTKVAVKSGQPLNMACPRAEQGAAPLETSAAQTPLEIYRSAVEAYPAAERPRWLLVIPIVEPSEAKHAPTKRLGALIVEQFRADSIPPANVQRAVVVADQVRVAMQRTELLAAIPFLSWWKRAAATSWLLRCGRLLLMLAVVCGIVAVATVPIEMRLAADGELRCESRRTVFAPEDGIVREVLVRHGDTLVAGQRMLSLDNFELAARQRDLTGQLLQARERQKSLEARRSGSRLTEREQIDLQTALVESSLAAEHLEQQIQRMQERVDRLVVVAPEAGVVTNWNLEQTLLHRPVRQGDALFQQIDPKGRWIVELRLLEDRSGYVARRLSELKEHEKLTIDFILATEPERRYPGTDLELSPRTDLTADGHIVRAIVELDPANSPPLRDGAEVKARLNCGQRSVGFVLFRELIEVIDTYLWY